MSGKVRSIAEGMTVAQLAELHVCGRPPCHRSGEQGETDEPTTPIPDPRVHRQRPARMNFPATSAPGPS